MKWWNIIKNEMGMMEGATSEIKPAKDMEEAKEHPVDPQIAEEEELEKLIEWKDSR